MVIDLSGNMNLGGILGIIGTLVGVLVGAVLTYFISLSVRRKERLIDGIYRPLLGQIGQILEKITDGTELPDLSHLEKTRQDGMYFVIDDTVKKIADHVYEELKDYRDFYEASTSSVDGIAEEEVQKIIPKLEKPERFQGRTSNVFYTAFIDHQFMGRVSLRDCLRIGKTPVQFLIEKRPVVKDSDITCLIAGSEVEREVTDLIVEPALKKADENKAIIRFRSKRQSLLKDIQELIEILKKQIKK